MRRAWSFAVLVAFPLAVACANRTFVALEEDGGIPTPGDDGGDDVVAPLGDSGSDAAPRGDAAPGTDASDAGMPGNDGGSGTLCDDAGNCCAAYCGAVCNNGNCGAAVLADAGAPTSLALSATDLYWTDQGVLRRVPKSGGAIVAVDAGITNVIAVAASNHLVVASGTPGVAPRYVPLDGGAPVALTPYVADATSIAVAANGASSSYASHSSTQGSAVALCPTSATDCSAVTSTAFVPSTLSMDPTSVVFVDRTTGALNRIVRATGAVEAQTTDATYRDAVPGDVTNSPILIASTKGLLVQRGFGRNFNVDTVSSDAPVASLAATLPIVCWATTTKLECAATATRATYYQYDVGVPVTHVALDVGATARALYFTTATSVQRIALDPKTP